MAPAAAERFAPAACLLHAGRIVASQGGDCMNRLPLQLAAGLALAGGLALTPQLGAAQGKASPQNEAYHSCDTQAHRQQYTGDALKRFMMDCLTGAGRFVGPAKVAVDPTQQRADCTAQAQSLRLSQQERQWFLPRCMEVPAQQGG